MKFPFMILVLVSVSLAILLVQNVESQNFIQGNGKGNIRVTKTCGGARKRSSFGTKSMGKKIKQNKKNVLKNARNSAILEAKEKNVLLEGQRMCPKISFSKIIKH